MKNPIQSLLISSLLTIALIELTSCSIKSPNDVVENEAQEGTDIAVRQINEDSELSQSLVEELAVRSIREVDIEDGFSFSNQRVIAVDFHFIVDDGPVQISIYSGLDEAGTSPFGLLENVNLNRSGQYKSSFSVPSIIDHLVVILDGDLTHAQILYIDQQDRIQHIFE